MKAVLFDLDDTLYAEMDFVRGGFRAVAGYLSARYGSNEDTTYHEMVVILQQQGRGRIFDRLLQGLNLYTEERVKLLVYLYRTHEPALRLYEDVIPVVEQLRRLGVRLGMITDGTAGVQRRKIAALGLAPLFDVIICTDELGQEHWKPSPIPFTVALEWLNATAADCTYVGDDPSKDFSGANSLGLMTIQVRRALERSTTHTRDDVDSRNARFVVDGLDQILPLIDDRLAMGQAAPRCCRATNGDVSGNDLGLKL